MDLLDAIARFIWGPPEAPIVEQPRETSPNEHRPTETKAAEPWTVFCIECRHLLYGGMNVPICCVSPRLPEWRFEASYYAPTIVRPGVHEAHDCRHDETLCGRTGRWFEPKDAPKPDAPRPTPGRAKGGHARAAKLPAERRSEIARKAAKTRWKK